LSLVTFSAAFSSNIQVMKLHSFVPIDRQTGRQTGKQADGRTRFIFHVPGFSNIRCQLSYAYI
jgi:hypothetical protein